ncbi:MAG: hypothetical protein HUU26_08120 [Gemmatimonadaceae bacterium]|nr:hypothetical protein [Gemmatimonadaceae bacterium]
MTERRPWYASPVAGGIVGVFAGGLTIMLLEAAAHQFIGTADPANPSTITTPMFLSVVVAWIAGCFMAGTVATVWSRAQTVLPGVVAGLVLLAGAVMNFVSFPHPAWVMAAAFLLMPAAAWLAARSRLVRRA